MRVSTAICAAAILSGCTGPLVETKAWPYLTEDREVWPTQKQPQKIQAYYYLPRSLITIQITSKDCKLEINTSAPTIIPDEQSRYAIVYTPQANYDDHLVVELTKDGLLKSVNPTSENKTAEIVASTINLASSIDKLLATQPLAKMDAPSSETCIDFDITLPADPLDLKRTIAEFKDEMNRRGTAVFVSGGLRETNLNSYSTDALGPRFVAPDCLDLSMDAAANAPRRSGVCYRPAVTVELEVRAHRFGKAGNGATAINRSVLIAPDPRQVFYIPLDRKVFAKFEVKLEFENGMLTKFDSNDPSEALAALAVPSTIIKAILGFKTASK